MKNKGGKGWLYVVVNEALIHWTPVKVMNYSFAFF